MSVSISNARLHGWQRPLHPLQIVGMSVFCFLVAAFYCFLGLFLGNRIAEITVNSVFSFTALSAALLFLRCAAIDPGDKSRFRFRKKKKKKRKGNTMLLAKLNYGSILGRILLRFFRRMERKILRTCIRRTYLDIWNTGIQMEPLVSFPLVLDHDSVAPNPKDDDVSFCSLCDFEVNRYSKHCRTYNRCVEGFDHHCRGISTYEYILAMKEENQNMEVASFEDSDFTSSDDESMDSDSPQKLAHFTSRDQNPQKLAIRIDGGPEKEGGFRATIDPWKLINLSREKALLAAEKAREKLVKSKPVPLKPLPLETRSGPVMDLGSITAHVTNGRFLNSPIQFSSPRKRLSCSPIQHGASTRSPKYRYRSDFDLKLTQVSRELESYISRQVLCSALKKDGSEASPR